MVLFDSINTYQKLKASLSAHSWKVYNRFDLEDFVPSTNAWNHLEVKAFHCVSYQAPEKREEIS